LHSPKIKEKIKEQKINIKEKKPQQIKEKTIK
jgi:hypothetical protein